MRGDPDESALSCFSLGCSLFGAFIVSRFGGITIGRIKTQTKFQRKNQYP